MNMGVNLELLRFYRDGKRSTGLLYYENEILCAIAEDYEKKCFINCIYGFYFYFLCVNIAGNQSLLFPSTIFWRLPIRYGKLA